MIKAYAYTQYTHAPKNKIRYKYMSKWTPQIQLMNISLINVAMSPLLALSHKAVLSHWRKAG